MGSIFHGLLRLVEFTGLVNVLMWSFAPVQGTEFCSVHIRAQTFACNNGSVMFIEKLNALMDSDWKCLHDLKFYCNKYRKCNMPRSCQNASIDARILYGCIPDVKSEKEHVCSGKTNSRDLEDQIFLVTPPNMKTTTRCNWRLKTLTNGVLILYVLNASDTSLLTIHHLNSNKQKQLHRAFVINVTANEAIDLTINPMSPTWLVAKLIHQSVKDVSLQDFISCPVSDKPKKVRSLAEICLATLAGYKIAVIVLCCAVLILLAILSIIIHCYCKKIKSTQRSRDMTGNRPTSTVIPYQTTLINGSKKNKLNQLNHNVSSPNHFRKDKHLYDHLNRYDSSYAVRFDPNKSKQNWKRSYDDSDSDSTYATVGENS
ncbi:uncharacterized protein LOC106879878 isoform X1 [Octopus bimaculoides]|uniref:CUB domain-containing protein n=2 Tax=Octopus bimaculoides TaxID=37653 RepID=A0A0L8G181_OCTBM|nr:uncharacterized protein LOC106879878 isoform X1 [Octopus bimaculoides]|eukprot:XP_014785088.1 PREDICTED: uncharacterized protein LOC106879878 [Octopus bimaculoides]